MDRSGPPASQQSASRARVLLYYIILADPAYRQGPSSSFSPSCMPTCPFLHACASDPAGSSVAVPNNQACKLRRRVGSVGEWMDEWIMEHVSECRRSRAACATIDRRADRSVHSYVLCTPAGLLACPSPREINESWTATHHASKHYRYKCVAPTRPGNGCRVGPTRSWACRAP